MKLKVMLVDDELLVRLGIKSLIDWENHNFEFIGDAADGEKALELMERQVPDILLTDIVMPRMDGLALIEAVKQRYPRMLVIVLSSHNEFDYVRKAMKLGARDYLLKTSLKPSELLDLLVEAAQKLAADHTTLSSTQSSIPAVDDRRSRMTHKLLHLLKGVNDDEAVSMANEDKVEELPCGRVLLVLRAKRIRDGAIEQSAARLLEHLIESELDGVLDSRPVAIRDNELAALLVASPDGGSGLDPDRVVEQLENAAGRLLGLSLQAQTSSELASWKEAAEFYEAAQAALSDSGMREPSREDIKRLIDHMKINIAQDFSLKQAADMINMSESYLSTIFKKETGLGFTDWINAMRVEEAARYLEHSSLPSYSIAEKVGYENINYFGRIFKKLKGVSPQKYRAQRQGNANADES
ncbi:response regulator [Paenibacillus sp. PR3]|uniref:Response regulator n=1 Tax=Paenibacillus terricola TaxID=2763503 RepID=A0ABR8N6J2_9BACL|nr:response regulator [Paenibacillus terricola]MBD3922454.1 response regulator [Paenibacillus terricola]